MGLLGRLILLLRRSGLLVLVLRGGLRLGLQRLLRHKLLLWRLLEGLLLLWRRLVVHFRAWWAGLVQLCRGGSLRLALLAVVEICRWICGR